VTAFFDKEYLEQTKKYIPDYRLIAVELDRKIKNNQLPSWHEFSVIGMAPKTSIHPYMHLIAFFVK
jgi:hypothetical protein